MGGYGIRPNGYLLLLLFGLVVISLVFCNEFCPLDNDTNKQQNKEKGEHAYFVLEDLLLLLLLLAIDLAHCTIMQTSNKTKKKANTPVKISVSGSVAHREKSTPKRCSTSAPSARQMAVKTISSRASTKASRILRFLGFMISFLYASVSAKISFSAGVNPRPTDGYLVVR